MLRAGEGGEDAANGGLRHRDLVAVLGGGDGGGEGGLGGARGEGFLHGMAREHRFGLGAAPGGRRDASQNDAGARADSSPARQGGRARDEGKVEGSLLPDLEVGAPGSGGRRGGLDRGDDLIALEEGPPGD